MVNLTVDAILPNLPTASRYFTALAISNGIAVLTLTFLLIRPAVALGDTGPLTFPMRSHLVNSALQVLLWCGPNVVYVSNPGLFNVYCACIALVQLNAFFILASVSNMCFYVVAVLVQIVHPLQQHVWFSPTRRRVALVLVWVVPAGYASVPTLVLLVKKTDVWQTVSLCYAHVLDQWYVYTFTACAGIYLVFLVSATLTILRTSTRQLRQIASLRGAVAVSNASHPSGSRSRVTRTYLLVAVVTGVVVELLIVLNVAILNVVIASCGKEACVYTYGGIVILTCFLDGVVLTAVKFRVTGARLKELVRSVC